MMKTGILLGTVLLLGLASNAHGAEMAVKVLDKEPPKEIGESIRKTLQPKVVQLLEGDKAVWEFWFRSEVPLKSKPESPAKALQALGEITPLGALVLAEPRRDYKDNEIPAGTYTIRFGLQPQDGDHLGTSEFAYFAVLIPAKSDQELAGIKTYKAMVKASGKSTATGHPAILSLRPPSAESPDAPTLTTPAPEHKAIRIKLAAKAPDSDQAIAIVFELVYQGKYKT
jgi:hypothetical protein